MDGYELLMNRKSIRAYEDRGISSEVKEKIFQGIFRAPTAGNMMLYSVIEVREQEKKNILSKTCDNQPFIATAPLVLVFLADYERWFRYFEYSGVKQKCILKNIDMRNPDVGDLLLACCDALIAAQNCVIACESLGLGSCYIGDIIENYEVHKELFNLPKYAFPIAMLCIGYPTPNQVIRKKPKRFKEEFILFKDKYIDIDDEFLKKFDEDAVSVRGGASFPKGIENFGQQVYFRKFGAEFSEEMSRSANKILQEWKVAMNNE
ncbi:MAG: nitroreductase family protein [Oscillospiraceae bacterium]|nr:nitroreductase family protein [Oscillospiraceae bacterium]